MGCFDFTCSVSGLPISCGTKVRWIMMGTSKYTKLGCHNTAFYSPVNIPISAKYNDYGSIEDYDEESVAFKSTLDILRMHSVEVGVGDNSCHDVKVVADMPFKSWLEAIWEGRVFMKRNPIRRKPVPNDDWEPEDNGRPNFKIVEKKLKAAGVSAPNGSIEADDVGSGIVRVRNTGYGECTGIDEAQKVLSQFYAVIKTPGSGSYAKSEELVVFPKVGSDHLIRYDNGGSNFNNTFRIVQSMIREDVWQLLLKTKAYNYNTSSREEHFEEARQAVRNNVEAALSRKESRKLLAELRKDESMSEKYKDLFQKITMSEIDTDRLYDIMSYTGISSGWSDRFLEEKDKEEFIEDSSQLLCASWSLDCLRQPWMSGYTIGEQHGDFDQHLEFSKGIQNICETQIRKNEEEWDE